MNKRRHINCKTIRYKNESQPIGQLSRSLEMVIYLFGRRLSLLFNVVFTAINRLSDFGELTLFPFGNTNPTSLSFLLQMYDNNPKQRINDVKIYNILR